MIVPNKVFNRPDGAVGTGLIIFAKHAQHAGGFGFGRVANAILNLMPGGISPQTLVACRSETVLCCRCAEIEDTGKVITLHL
jgi:hypothetical protein